MEYLCELHTISIQSKQSLGHANHFQIRITKGKKCTNWAEQILLKCCSYYHSFINILTFLYCIHHSCFHTLKQPLKNCGVAHLHKLCDSICMVGASPREPKAKLLSWVEVFTHQEPRAYWQCQEAFGKSFFKCFGEVLLLWLIKSSSQH